LSRNIAASGGAKSQGEGKRSGKKSRLRARPGNKEDQMGYGDQNDATARFAITETGRVLLSKRVT